MMASCQKLGIILVMNWFKYLVLSKNFNNQKCAHKLVFFDEKKMRKIPINFWHRKLTLNVTFWQFFTPPHYSNSQNSMIFYGCWLLGKNLSNFVYPNWKLNNLYYHNTSKQTNFPDRNCSSACENFWVREG